MCGYFTTRRLEDGSTKTFYNGYFGFVRPDGATVNAEGICFDGLFLSFLDKDLTIRSIPCWNPVAPP